MNYITEARRLGVDLSGLTLSDDEASLRWPIPDRATYENGMCITGCTICRSIRNKVRAAQEEEERDLQDFFGFFEEPRIYTASDLDRAYDLGLRQGKYDAAVALKSDIERQHEDDMSGLDAILARQAEWLDANPKFTLY